FPELNPLLFVAIAISSYRRGSLQSPGASALSSKEGLGRSIQGADALRYTPPTLLSVGIRGLSLLSSQCRQVINYPEIFPQKKIILKSLPYCTARSSSHRSLFINYINP
uniref:Uncharacterized protein n=1 Tax=Aegilops tauschii subsp. strangulata TaxID=200361 RepID=A0A453Q406_AEGTS